MTNGDIKALAIICIKNVAIMICFTILAVVFQKWWISLFSILFYSTYSTEDD